VSFVNPDKYIYVKLLHPSKKELPIFVMFDKGDKFIYLKLVHRIKKLLSIDLRFE
jgi:hypothetical protein